MKISHFSIILLLILMTMQQNSSLTYDLVVIGGGSAGLTAAKFSNTFSKSSVIIEKSKLGGDCTWTGCIPSKTLLSVSKKVFVTRNMLSSQYLNGDNNVSVDMKKVQDEIYSKIQTIYKEDDSPAVLKEKFNVDTIKGSAMLLDSNTIKVSLEDSEDTTIPISSKEVEIKAKYGIVLATGAIPKLPMDVPSGMNYATYETIFDILPEIGSKYKDVTIVGGGPIGCELCQALCNFDVCNVTLVAERLLPRNEPEVDDIMRNVFANQGIKHVPGKLTSLKCMDNGNHLATCAINNENVGIKGDLILLATGRKPNIKNLGLETLGITTNVNNGIEVDNYLQTSIKGIYAAGDCTGDEQYTHYAGYQGAIAARNILLPFNDPGILTTTIPSTTFTNPEIASVGLTEKQAREENDTIKIIHKPLEHVDRAVCESTTNGFMKFVLDTNDKILGATIVSPNAGEIISEIAVAMNAKKSLSDLATVMHPYPSYSFALQVIGADLYYEKLGKYKWILNVLKFLGL